MEQNKFAGHGFGFLEEGIVGTHVFIFQLLKKSLPMP